MGEQIELQQQTRVLLLNGQTIILQGDISDNSISEINADILEQALNEVTCNTGNDQSRNAVGNTSNATSHNTNTCAVVEEESPAIEGNLEEHDPNSFVAIFENENGGTQTVQLTYEQAAALGIQVPTNTEKIQESANLAPQNVIKTETNQNFAQTSNEFMLPETPQSSSILGSLLKPVDRSLLNTAPQYVTNSMPYSLKLQDQLGMTSSCAQVPVSSIPLITQATTSLAASSSTSASSQTICMNQATSLMNQQKVAFLPIANKNANRPPLVRPLVRLKPQSTNMVSPAIIRSAATKTVIPKIQGTPTTMGNLTLTSALPISSTASMVRVVNTPATTNNNKPSTVTSMSSTVGSVKSTDSTPNVTKPLGSSENPIQLVQHGQTFHSMQPLSQEQLKQIATVLQQKQLDTSRNSKNVLYDATTNTRIIYRVVYPEDLALKKPTMYSTVSSTASSKGRGGSTTGARKGRPPKTLTKVATVKKVNSEEDEDQQQDADLSKGEKEERKKALPRTRSGRLSRPPRHMVKDYKRIHHLDFAEPDLDDSDGGYSDYRISDSEPQESTLEESMVQPTGNTDALSTKRAIHSKFRCPTCQKMYLGYRRLARHFETNPDHGSMDNVPRKPPPVPVEPNYESTNGTSNETTSTKPSFGPGRGKGKKRGVHFILSPAQKAERRRNKLREFLASYDLAEVSEIAGPVVAQSLDTWRYLQMRVSACEDQPSRLAAVIAELQSLLETARFKVAEVISAPPANTDNVKVHKVEVNNEMVAAALNISCGFYNIQDASDRQLQWYPSRLDFPSSTSSSLAPDSLPQPLSLEDTSNTSDLTDSPAKKQKLWHEDLENDKDEHHEDKSFFDSTLESEKPSDTSIGSDTPLDDIVKAELKNLASKSGLEDFVAPPAPPVSSNLGHSQVVDFVTSTFTSQVQEVPSHFPSDLVMAMSSVTSNVPNNPLEASSATKLPSVHFQLSSASTRLDLSGNNIDVNLDSHLDAATHELDFEALSEEFNRNTSS